MPSVSRGGCPGEAGATGAENQRHSKKPRDDFANQVSLVLSNKRWWALESFHWLGVLFVGRNLMLAL